jgi:Leucine-rich repeat (LRR) protein
VADLNTCTCAFTTGGTNTTVTIDCTGKNLTDSAVATLVDKIAWAAIDTLILDGNKMTKIPPGLSGLMQLSSLSAASNSITAINATDLSSLPATLKKLNFASNSISTVAAGSFPGQLLKII